MSQHIKVAGSKGYTNLWWVSRGYWGGLHHWPGGRVLRTPHLHEEKFQVLAGQDLKERGHLTWLNYVTSSGVGKVRGAVGCHGVQAQGRGGVVPLLPLLLTPTLALDRLLRFGKTQSHSCPRSSCPTVQVLAV